MCDYAYKNIEEYEAMLGKKITNQGARIAWDMARTTNAMLGTKKTCDCTFNKCDSESVCKKLGMCRYEHHKGVKTNDEKKSK